MSPSTAMMRHSGRVTTLLRILQSTDDKCCTADASHMELYLDLKFYNDQKIFLEHGSCQRVDIANFTFYLPH
jgi:hypothetical protein